MKLNYGFSVEKLQRGMLVAVMKTRTIQREAYHLPIDFISESKTSGIYMAEVLSVDKELKNIKVLVNDKRHFIHYTHNETLNYIMKKNYQE